MRQLCDSVEVICVDVSLLIISVCKCGICVLCDVVYGAVVVVSCVVVYVIVDVDDVMIVVDVDCVVMIDVVVVV